MNGNASMPPGGVIPVLQYPDVGQAVMWLCEAFGFVERLRIGDHRAQLLAGDRGGALVVAKGSAPAGQGVECGISIMIGVDDVDRHYARAVRAGATIVSTPQTFPFGERQYSASDPTGYGWTFTESVADVDPSSWGGVLVG